MKILLVNNHTKHFSELIKFLPGEVSVIDKTLFNNDINFNAYDLVVFSGGSDVPTVMRHPDVYSAEIFMIKNTQIPILGICLGAEIINVSFGGNIKDTKDKFLGDYIINIKDDLAKKILGNNSNVSERHTLAVDILPECFKVVADSDRGVEIFQHKNLSIIGIQFHPELSNNLKLKDWIFSNLIGFPPPLTKGRIEEGSLIRDPHPASPLSRGRRIKYIDIHSHLGLLTLEEDKEKIIYKMMEKGVGTFVIGVDFETSKKAVEMAEKYDFMWAGIGLHPTDNDKEIFDLEKYQKLSEHERVVCIGECGLDYFRDSNVEIKIKQKELFEKHIQIALLSKKPLMIHSRPSKGSQDAYEDTLDILEKFSPTPSASGHSPSGRGRKILSGNFHFFVGDTTIAQRILDLGFTMSFDGPITFSHDYDGVIKFLPLESIMCETDAPFAAPAPYRGKTCEPWMVEEVYKKVAEIKRLPIEKVIEVIRENIKRVFKV